MDPTLTINEIVLRHPAALPILNRFGIDACCGGGIPLETVARKHGLELTAIVAALDTVVTREVA